MTEHIARFFVSQPEIVTGRLVLRRFQPSDAEAVFEYASRETVAKYVLFPTHQSIADSQEFIALATGDDPIGFGIVWAIVLRSSQKLIGSIGIHKIDLVANKLEAGYALHDEYWNSGYTTEALAAVIREVFRHTPINRIEARYAKENLASGAVMKKCGMQYEGTLRESALMKSGLTDMAVCSVLRRESDTEIVIEAYNPDWINAFNDESALLLNLLRDDVIIEHIGSTAVEGLAAKPIIDIMIGVHHLRDAEEMIPKIERLGYHYISLYEDKLPERRYFNKISDGGIHTHHIHLVETTSDFWKRHLYFRDRLRADSALANQYAALKQDLARRFQFQRKAYTDAKTNFIMKIENERSQTDNTNKKL